MNDAEDILTRTFLSFRKIAKETPKPAPAPASHDDDIVEFLDDDDTSEGQLQFDMSAMNFGTSTKTTTKSTSTAKNSTSSSMATTTAPLLSAASDRSGMSSPVESIPPSGISTPSKASTRLGKRIDVVSEYQKRIAEKESLNLVVIGKRNTGEANNIML